MAVQIPPGKTLIDTFDQTFTAVPIDAENDNAISTTEFLDAAKSFVTIFDLLGGKIFYPVKSDLIGNVDKLRARQTAYPAESATIQDLVRNEIKAGQSNAASALTWLTRGLKFTCLAISQNLEIHTDDMVKSFTDAYGKTLKPHHNFVVKQLFSAAMRACPTREDFYNKLGDNQEKVVDDLRQYLAALTKLVALIEGFLETKEAKF